MSNLNSILSLALKPGKEYLRAVLIRLIIFAAVLFVSCILIVIGLGFLVWSSFLYLSTVLNPYVAALISGLIAILLAGALVLLVSIFNESAGGKKRRKAPGYTSQFEDASQIIEKHPLESGLMALAAGFIAGSSPDAQRALSELFITLSKSTSD